ncbi:MAG: cytidylate kinase-like family protein, partial [Deltaproteobacteria bacterium]|nr:cytidylate kinase-like family protein [Deltaproteobacteria bacterium]
IGHALKVRIIADLDDRIRMVMDRDGVSSDAAMRFIQRIDKERIKWGKQTYGIDPGDASLYDLVLHVNKLTVDDAVDIICHTARLERLQATEESRRAIEDAALDAAVKAALVKDYPDVDIHSQDGVVFVNAKTSESEEMHMTERIEKIAMALPGVKEVKVQLHWFVPFGT